MSLAWDDAFQASVKVRQYLGTLDRSRGGLMIPRRVKDTLADPLGYRRLAQARR